MSMICAAAKRREDEQNEQRVKKHDPNEHGHSAQRHARAAHAYRGGNHIDGAGDGAETRDQHAEYPEIGAGARRKRFGCERRIAEPAHVGHRAESVA